MVAGRSSVVGVAVIYKHRMMFPIAHSTRLSYDGYLETVFRSIGTNSLAHNKKHHTNVESVGFKRELALCAEYVAI